MYFMYGTLQGNVAVALKIYTERFPGRYLLDRRAFKRSHDELCASRSFYALRGDTGSGRYRRYLVVKKLYHPL